jgi:hypothetical protein
VVEQLAASSTYAGRAAVAAKLLSNRSPSKEGSKDGSALCAGTCTLPAIFALIHPSAWKVNSAKLDFRFTEFSEVHTIPIDSLRESSESPSIVGLLGARRLSQQSHPFSAEPRKRCLPVLLSFPSSREAPGEVLPAKRQ